MCSAVGSFGYAGRFTLYVVLTNRDANPATNQSVVDYNVYFQNTSGGGTFTSNTRLYFAINGGVVKDSTSSITGPRNGTVTIASGSTTVSHNNDGTKSIDYHALVNSTSFGIYGELSGNFTLTTIPRASSITCSTANIGSKPTIKITSASTSFTHNVYGAFGNLSFSALSNKVGGSYTDWTIPTDFYSQIPNATSGTGTMYCQTYSGSTLVGTTSIQFSVTVNESACKPTVTGTVVDTNSTTIALTGNSNKLIKGKSTAKITVSPSAKNYASIKTVTIDGVATTDNSRTISNVTKSSFAVVVTDSRGYTNAAYSATASGGIVDYIPLTINANFHRPQPTTGEVSLTYSGNYFNGSFGSVSNTLSISWKYREKGASSWTNGGTITPTLSGNTISNKTISLGKSFNYQKSYEFQILASDKLTSITQTYQVAMGMPVFHWGKNFFSVNVRLKANTYFSGVINPAAWYYIGEIQMASQGSYAILDCYLGEGQNGGADQNTHMQILIKQGWTGNNLPIGLTVRFTQNTKTSVKVRISHSTSTKCKLYMYMPFAYNDLTYTINGSYTSFTPSNTVISSEPTYDKEATYYKPYQYYAPVSLFDNSSGTTGNVTLSQSAENFSYIEIFFKSRYSQFTSTRIYSPNGKTANLHTWHVFASSSGTVVGMSRNVNISGTTLSTGTSDQYGEWWSYQNQVLNQNNIYITKVIGYR